MDQKKVLWVVAGIGIFLVIVICAALMFWVPPHKEVADKGAQNWSAPQTPENLNVLGNNISDGGANAAPNQFATVNGTPIGGGEAITPAPPPPPVSRPAPAAKPRPAASSVSVESKSVQKAAPKSTPKKAEPPKTVNRNYWVQAASYGDQILAEQARDTLIAARMDSEIFTAEPRGAFRFRVRVGPYKTKSEAEYWLNIVKDIRNAKGQPLYPDCFVTSNVLN